MTTENQWDKRYSETNYAYGTSPNDFLVASHNHLKPGAKILCLAEGEGRNAVWLAKQGFRVTAVDSSAVGLQKAETLATRQGVTIGCIVADLAEFDLGKACWDGIISIFCHLPPPLRKQLFADIPTSLTPGGVFLLEGFTPKQLQYGTGGPPLAELMVSETQLREELSALNILHCTELDREIYEGEFHNGLAAVVQFIGCKVSTTG